MYCRNRRATARLFSWWSRVARVDEPLHGYRRFPPWRPGGCTTQSAALNRSEGCRRAGYLADGAAPRIITHSFQRQDRHVNRLLEKRNTLFYLIALISAAIIAGGASAQDTYPSKPITL